MTDRFKFPCDMTFSVKWMNGKYKSYTKKVYSWNHYQKSVDFYESNGGKVIGTTACEAIKT